MKKTAAEKMLALAVEANVKQFVDMCEEACKTHEDLLHGMAKDRMQDMLQTLHMIGRVRFPDTWDELSPMARRDADELRKFFEGLPG